MRKRHDKRFPNSTSTAYGTYAPVVENATFKTLCPVVAHEDLEFDMIDVNQAFTCAPIRTIQFLLDGEDLRKANPDRIPSSVGMVRVLFAGPGKVYFEQPEGLLWNEELDQFLLTQNFSRSAADPCLYTKRLDTWV